LKRLTFIFAIAFALRVLILISINNFYSYGGMSGFYGNTAFNILNYQTYSMNRDLDKDITLFQSSNETLLEPVFYKNYGISNNYITAKRPPGYSLFLAGVFRFSPKLSFKYVIFFQIIPE
jgi:hypothetical protein